MKQFIFDRLVDRENICNLDKEKKRLLLYIKKKSNVVIYAPRNFGKTSLIKNVVICDFRNTHKKSFVFFVDLLGVRDLNSIIKRLMKAFEKSFNESFPVKNIFENIKAFLSMLRPEVSIDLIDSITGNPSISLGISPEKKEYSISYVFHLISKISQKIPVLIVIDEFQDIAGIDAAQALFRTVFQEIETIPVILMGSKRHILNTIFSNPDAPLASWGVDLEIHPIPYNEYHSYINERFSLKSIQIGYDEAVYLQDLMYRIPESINIFCQQIMDMYENINILKENIHAALKGILDNREARYEMQIQGFSKTEETVLTELVKLEKLEKPQSKLFIAKTNLTGRTLGRTIKKLIDIGIIEKQNTFYRVSDPLFNFYLKYYR